MSSSILTKETHGEVAAKASRGFVAVGVSALAQQAIAFVTQLVLARLLSPEYFGILAYGLVVVGFFNVFTSLVNDRYLVQVEDNFERRFNTIFTMEVLLSGFFAVAVCVLAPWILERLGRSALVPLVQVLSLSFFSNALRSPLSALERDMSFYRSRWPGVVSQAVAGMAAVAFALAGLGIWSLVAWRLTAIFLEAGLAWHTAGITPRLTFQWQREDVLSILRFSVPLVLSGLLVFIYSNADYYIVGHLTDDVQLGFYWLAFTACHSLLRLKTPINAVLLPAFCRIKDDQIIIRDFEKLTRITAFIYLLPAIIFLFYGGSLLRLAYGDKWLPALPVFQIFLFLVAVRGATAYGDNIFTLKGRTDINLRLATIYLVLMLPLTYFGARFGGITGTALGVCAANITMVAVSCWHVWRLTGHRMWYLAGLLGAPLLVGILGQRWAQFFFTDKPGLQMVAFMVTFLFMLIMFRQDLVSLFGRMKGLLATEWRRTALVASEN